MSQFALDLILGNKIITEYTGDIVDERVYLSERNSTYTASGQYGETTIAINALSRGGAARFALHLPRRAELEQYQFNPESLQSRIATANSYIYPNRDGRLFLASSRIIYLLEQIGFDYGPTYPWQNKAELFNITGIVIPREHYTQSYRDLIIEDQTTQNGTTTTTRVSIVHGLSNEELREHILNFRIDDHSLFHINRIGYLVNTQELIRAMNRPTRTIIVAGIVVLVLQENQLIPHKTNPSNSHILPEDPE